MKRMPNIHPNGFWVYIIKAFWNGARIRLHYWPRGVKRLDTPHDHHSWFISIPIWGRFLEKRFTDVKGDTHKILQCHSSWKNGVPVTKSIGDGSLTITSQRRRYPLIPYFCGSKTIHSLTPCGVGPALTLVFFGAPNKTPRAWIRKL